MCYVFFKDKGKMKFLDFLKNIPPRLRWSVNGLTIIEFIYISAVPFMLKFADSKLFTEGNWIENLQLLVLAAACVIAIKSPKDKTLFTALALIIILMLMRETNLGRAYFCEKYLPPEEICRWKNLKYGFAVEPLRDLYGMYIIYYIWKQKVYNTIWQYILYAPAFVWDSLIFIGSAIMATLAECPIIDNEILEESCEMLMYIAFTNLILRYAKNNSVS